MSRIKVLKICCASETKMIEKIVRPLPGVTEVRVNVVTKTAYVGKSLKYSVYSSEIFILRNEKFHTET